MPVLSFTKKMIRGTKAKPAVSGGRILAPSTPWGQQGWWYDACVNNPGGEWLYIEADWTQCPRITPQFIANERATFGDEWVQQEFECKFLKAARSAFRAEDIDAVFDEEVEAWQL